MGYDSKKKKARFRFERSNGRLHAQSINLLVHRLCHPTTTRLAAVAVHSVPKTFETSRSTTTSRHVCCWLPGPRSCIFFHMKLLQLRQLCVRPIDTLMQNAEEAIHGTVKIRRNGTDRKKVLCAVELSPWTLLFHLGLHPNTCTHTCTTACCSPDTLLLL